MKEIDQSISENITRKTDDGWLERKENYEKLGVTEEYIEKYELIVMDLLSGDGSDLGYGLAGAGDLLRFELQNREAGSEETPSWGDDNLIYLKEVASQVEGINNSGIWGEIGIGSTGRGLKNLKEVFPEAKIIGIERDGSYVESVEKRLLEEGYKVRIVSSNEDKARLKQIINEGDRDEIVLVVNPADEILTQMAGELNGLIMDKVGQHLDNNNPADVFGQAVYQALDRNGKLIVMDLELAHPEDGWVIRPDDENDPGVAFHHIYYEKVVKPAWEKRGARLFESEESIIEFTESITGMKMIPDTVKVFDSGECRELNSMENVIAATMTAAIVGGARRGLQNLRKAAEHNPQLAKAAADLAEAVIKMEKAGLMYLEKVVLNPEITINMPRFAGMIFEK